MILCDTITYVWRIIKELNEQEVKKGDFKPYLMDPHEQSYPHNSQICHWMASRAPSLIRGWDLWMDAIFYDSYWHICTVVIHVVYLLSHSSFPYVCVYLYGHFMYMQLRQHKTVYFTIIFSFLFFGCLIFYDGSRKQLLTFHFHISTVDCNTLWATLYTLLSTSLLFVAAAWSGLSFFILFLYVMYETDVNYLCCFICPAPALGTHDTSMQMGF